MNDNFQRALDAEPQLLWIDDLVTVFLGLRNGSHPACGLGIWETITALARNWVGPGRGYPPQNAVDRLQADGIARPPQPISVFDPALLRRSRVEAQSDTERWLRTPEAWDAVTARWLRQLEDAFPCPGCHMSATQLAGLA